MNQPSSTDKTDAPLAQPAPALLERRAMLLKSMGKGSAVLAAASLPIHTLANTPTIVIQGKTDLKGRPIRCSLSGMQSGMGSRMPATDTCTGKSPGYWHQSENWTPAQLAVISPSPPSNKPTFNSFFGPPSTSNGDCTLEQYLRTIGAPHEGQVKGLNDTDDWHWIAAWMNAMANGQAGIQNYPYSAPQIVQMYRDPSSFNTTREQALTFLKLIEGTAG